MAWGMARLRNKDDRVHLSPLTTVGGLTPWQLRCAHDRIDARLDQEVSLSELASHCGLSISHFARAFARSTGVPPHRWLMQRRVGRAKELMLTGTPLAEIALMCGFSDQSHLTRVFSQTTGMTPGRWRESQTMQRSRMAVAAIQEADPRRSAGP
jgi:AraC-like DNA-binding protein